MPVLDLPIFDHTKPVLKDDLRVICENATTVWIAYSNERLKNTADVSDWRSKIIEWVPVTPSVLATNRVTFETILKQCELEDASDCHFFSNENTVEIWLRKKTKLKLWVSVSHTEYAVLLNQFKLHAGCDISITTVPQDGQFEHKTLSIRLATCPTNHLEDLACRLFKKEAHTQLDHLGMPQEALSLLKSACNEKNGLILVTGPTGSGKTTTLYAACSYIQTLKTYHVISIEDPIEKDIPGIRQTQINNQAGYNWSKALRSVLRQDPDVICVGEIRDAETAKLAIEAAYTGHLVLASVHTSSIEKTLKRLQSLQVESDVLKQCLKAVFSQQLKAIDTPNGTQIALQVEAKCFGSN